MTAARGFVVENSGIGVLPVDDINIRAFYEQYSNALLVLSEYDEPLHGLLKDWRDALQKCGFPIVTIEGLVQSILLCDTSNLNFLPPPPLAPVIGPPPLTLSAASKAHPPSANLLSGAMQFEHSTNRKPIVVGSTMLVKRAFGEAVSSDGPVGMDITVRVVVGPDFRKFRKVCSVRRSGCI